MITRRLLAPRRQSTKSILLLGPRQTGKSALVSQLQPDLTVNLFHEPTYRAGSGYDLFASALTIPFVVLWSPGLRRCGRSTFPVRSASEGQ
jgi:hypothetical protein